MAFQLLGQEHGTGDEGVYRCAVTDRVKAIGAGNLATDASIAVPVWPAAWLGLPSLKGRIWIAAEPGCAKLCD